MTNPARKVDAILFDKDGTLFDFHATWNVWAGGAIETLAEGDAVLATRIAEAVRYDLPNRRFFPDSIAIAGTNREIAKCIAPVLPGWTLGEIDRFLSVGSAQAPLEPAVDLGPFLDGLAAQDLRLGVMTNDTEHGARSHLSAMGVYERFDFVAGADSGYGAKPNPGPLLAFADAVGVAPERVVMVGDSAHDLIAGRRAGMQTLGVLTGVALAVDLAPMADAVLPDIGHIPRWLTN